MGTLRFLVSMIGSMLLALPSWAVEPVPTAALRIGYVDVARIFTELDEARDGLNSIKNEFEQKQRELDEAQGKLAQKKEEFDKQKDMMNANARMSKEQEIAGELNNLQNKLMQYQQDIQLKHMQMKDDILRKIRLLVEKIGDRDGYTVILNSADAVLYYKRHMDITDDILREYAKAYRLPSAESKTKKVSAKEPTK